MAENYFENIRTVGATLDEGINKLQEVWELPHFLLCKNNVEDHLSAKQLVQNLKNELRILKETLEEYKASVASIKETQCQFLEETTEAIKILKQEVDDIKVLFVENGYVEEPIEQDLLLLNSQLESLSVNNNSALVKDDDMSQSYNDDASYNESSTDTDKIQNMNSNTTLSNLPKTLLDKIPPEPNYSPCFYKMIKKY